MLPVVIIVSINKNALLIVSSHAQHSHKCLKIRDAGGEARISKP